MWLQILWFLDTWWYAREGMVDDNGRVCEARCSVKFTVVVVQLAVWATHDLLVLSAAPLAHALRHIVDHVTLSALATVLYEAGVCRTSETQVCTTVFPVNKEDFKTKLVVSSLQLCFFENPLYWWRSYETLAYPSLHAMVHGFSNYSYNAVWFKEIHICFFI